MKFSELPTPPLNRGECMKICIAGLGLIGGSFAKTIKKRTEHEVYGIDLNSDVLSAALREGAIDKKGGAELLSECDMTIVCLYPDRTVKFILDNLDKFRRGSLVIDVCGVKAAVVDAVSEPLRERGIEFIGVHPMAGREFSGFDYALDNLFDEASFIITPTEKTDPEKLRFLEKFALDIGFRQYVLSTTEEHDRIIAYTSQLAHVVSNAYVKSPSLSLQAGFSAGSFQDLTRVAKLNEDMWSTLFLMNKQPLIDEVETIIRHLEEYKRAMETDDREYLMELLRDGRIKKEWSIENTPR